MVRQAPSWEASLSFTASGRQLKAVNWTSRRQTLPVLRCKCQSSLPIALDSARKVAIFVEPSPFSHVSGMKIRFSNLIKGLREIGDDVTVVTPCVNPPKTYCGAKVSVRGKLAAGITFDSDFEHTAI